MLVSPLRSDLPHPVDQIALNHNLLYYQSNGRIYCCDIHTTVNTPLNAPNLFGSGRGFDATPVEILPLPLLDGVVQFFCDARAQTFVAVHQHARSSLRWPPVPDADRQMAAGLTQLLADAQPDDGIADVVFQLASGAQLAAHRFVLLQRMPKGASALLAEVAASGGRVSVPDVWLRLLLRFVYGSDRSTEAEALAIGDPVVDYPRFAQWMAKFGFAIEWQ